MPEKKVSVFLLQLLTPHLRYTLEINSRGRNQLISPDGIFKRVCLCKTLNWIGIFKWAWYISPGTVVTSSPSSQSHFLFEYLSLAVLHVVRMIQWGCSSLWWWSCLCVGCVYRWWWPLDSGTERVQDADLSVSPAPQRFCWQRSVPAPKLFLQRTQFDAVGGHTQVDNMHHTHARVWQDTAGSSLFWKRSRNLSGYFCSAFTTHEQLCLKWWFPFNPMIEWDSHIAQKWH